MPLVLTRRAGERVRIGDDVTVEVIEIDGGKVRLRFTAPESVTIFREEIIGKARRESVPVSKRVSDAVTALREGQP